MESLKRKAMKKGRGRAARGGTTGRLIGLLSCVEPAWTSGFVGLEINPEQPPVLFWVIYYP